MIISNTGAEPVIYDLDGFVVPREKILTDGTLTEFSEWEVAERTEIFGTIAHRSSEYRKSGFSTASGSRARAARSPSSSRHPPAGG